MAEQTETPGEKKKSWFQAHIHSRIWHATHSQWPFATAENQSFFHKMMPLLALIPTTVLSSVLLYGIGRPPFKDNEFYNFVNDQRATTQAVLNFLTTIFGVWNLFVLKSVINFSIRNRLKASEHSPSSIQLRWWKALAAYKFDWSLPWKYSFSMFLVWALALLPSSLWTGALTPNLVTLNTTFPVTLPQYVSDPDGAYWNATWTPIAPHKVVRTPRGSFSYTPAYDRGGSMINTAAGVISDKDGLGTRPRSDKTGYTYKQRSFGVGSSMGLFTDFSDFVYYNHSTTFAYQEKGYNTTVHCAFNVSSKWGILPEVASDQGSNDLVPNVYLAGGATPDGGLDWQLEYSAVSNANVVSINAHPDLGSTGHATVVITTGSGAYSSLNQSQCSVQFIPTLFDVSVDLSSNEITVTNAGTAPDMDPTAQIGQSFTAWHCQFLPSLDSLSSATNDVSGCTNYSTQGQPGLGNLATRALRQLNDLSTLDISLQTSNLGEMFLSLVENEIQYDENEQFEILDFDLESPDTSTNATTMEYSIEQGIKSLLDDSLLAFASAQLVLNHNSSFNVTNGTLDIGAVQVGESSYVYILFAFNIVLVLIFIVAIVLTHFWAHLPLSDDNVAKSIDSPISMGGAGKGAGEAVVTIGVERQGTSESETED